MSGEEGHRHLWAAGEQGKDRVMAEVASLPELWDTSMVGGLFLSASPMLVP